MSDSTGLIAVIGLAFVVPLLLTRIVIRASWKQCGIALAVVWGLLVVLGLSWGGTLDEGLGWAAILSLFLSIPLVPAIAFAIKKARWA